MGATICTLMEAFWLTQCGRKICPGFPQSREGQKTINQGTENYAHAKMVKLAGKMLTSAGCRWNCSRFCISCILCPAELLTQPCRHCCHFSFRRCRGCRRKTNIASLPLLIAGYGAGANTNMQGSQMVLGSGPARGWGSGKKGRKDLTFCLPLVWMKIWVPSEYK